MSDLLWELDRSPQRELGDHPCGLLAVLLGLAVCLQDRPSGRGAQVLSKASRPATRMLGVGQEKLVPVPELKKLNKPLAQESETLREDGEAAGGAPGLARQVSGSPGRGQLLGGQQGRRGKDIRAGLGRAELWQQPPTAAPGT